jgi:drug/metabolite transporter (DMT)-like permease
MILAAGVVALAWAAPLIRIADPAPALAIAALRMTFAAPPMALWAARLNARRPTLTAAEWGWLVLAGLVLAGHFGFWVESVQRTSILSSVVLVTMQPLFVAIGGWLFLGERVVPAVAAGIGVASVGSVLLVSQSPGTSATVTGDLYALAGGALSGAYLLLGRKMRRALPVAVYGAVVYAAAAVALLLAVLLTGTSLGGFPLTSYVAIALLAVVPQLIGHNAVNWALGSLPAAVVAVAILGEPLGAAAIGAVLLDEVPTLREAAAGAVVLLGVALTVRYGARPVPATTRR